MSDVWFRHMSSLLSEKGLSAYIWYPAEDQFEWAGNAAGLFGVLGAELPGDTPSFQKTLNPQFLPVRMKALHDLMQKTPVGDALPECKIVYKIRRANGMQLDVEETATLQHDPLKGMIVNGMIRIIEHKAETKITNSPSVQGYSSEVVRPDRGLSHYGRIAVMQKMDEWQERQCSTGEGNTSQGYLLSVGVDRISMYNEAYGPRYTDEILEKISQRLGQIVGQNGSMHRIDGDVFAMLFPSAPHNEMAAVAKYVLNNFHDRPLQGSRGPVGVSVSIGGILLNPAQKADPASILVKAELAMRSAKDQGRGCYVSYVDAADKAQDNHFLLTSGDRFLQALRENRVKLAFQPIINASDREVSFHECLIRLIDENGKMQSAGNFYPAIEKLGLSRLVDQFALRTAINELSLFPHLKLSVNVSPATLMNRNWLRGLVMALRDNPSVARRLVIEITESAVIDDPERITMVTNTLRDLGCKIALDDFGAGYTAFTQLKDLDLDIVKIDKSFVRGIGEDTNRLFIQTLQSLADGVNVETVGEGAETMGEADMLARDGIDYIQGYVYGFPQVERVWLPKEHTHRRIIMDNSTSLGNAKITATADFEEDLNEEIVALVRG